jgi:hypothetical protein
MKVNVREFLQKRPLSWSSLSAFEYNPDEWYRKYILGEKTPDSKEMIFGKVFAHSIEIGKPLAPVTIVGKAEHQFKVVFNGIPLIGYADNFCDKTHRKLVEYKTAKTLWTQEKVNDHGQLTMYCLMNLITNKVPPEEVNILLECIQTEETGDFKIQLKKPVIVHKFKTKRTTADVIAFGMRINRTVEAMQKYCDERA